MFRRRPSGLKQIIGASPKLERPVLAMFILAMLVVLVWAAANIGLSEVKELLQVLHLIDDPFHKSVPLDMSSGCTVNCG